MSTKAKIFLISLVVLTILGLFLQNVIHKKYEDVVESGTTQHSPSDDPHSSNGSNNPDAALAVLTMDEAERRAKGIQTAVAAEREIAEEITVPGEVKIDLYRAAQITPRISAQIVARHAQMGDKVKRGDALVTLTSVEMADAQGELIVAHREWKRVQELGKEIVSERRYVEAQVSAQKARAKVLAYGMTPREVTSLLADEGAGNATGTFKLYAPQNGTIVSDNFVVGEIVEPGKVLFSISDETYVWVEAQLRPEQTTHIEVGTPVKILAQDQHPLAGEVRQIHHNLDEATRTLPVRIEVRNLNDELHTGQFVNVVLRISQPVPVLAVPESAVILFDGSPAIFKLEGEEVRAIAVETGLGLDGWVEIKQGLKAGDKVVTAETFFLKSLLLKSEMGEGHGH